LYKRIIEYSNEGGDRMKFIAIALFILMAVVQQSTSSSPIDNSYHQQASDSSITKIEAKIADALRGIGSATSAVGASSLQEVNESSINSSPYNLSINASALNSSVLNGSGYRYGSEASMVSGTSASPQEMGTSTKGASNGFWGIQADKHVMGQSDIKSKLFLTGNFDVDKTVSFSDRGS
jgi:hypothetical protein